LLRALGIGSQPRHLKTADEVVAYQP